MTLATTIPAIERTLVLRASPARVWRALTDAGELSHWFGQAADLRPEVGYDGWMEWDGHGRYAMRVEEADAPLRDGEFGRYDELNDEARGLIADAEQLLEQAAEGDGGEATTTTTTDGASA